MGDMSKQTNHNKTTEMQNTNIKRLDRKLLNKHTDCQAISNTH